MTEFWPVAVAAFMAGLLGSAHCLGMCAGMSGLFAAKASAASLRSKTPLAVAYNLGRVGSYAVLGTLVGLLGKTFVHAIPQLAGPVRLAGGILIVLVGLQIAFRLRLLAPVEKAGAALWAFVAPATQGLFPIENLPRAFGLGLCWGLLPCGLVYSVLLLAGATANPLGGGLVMVAFGAGTLPAMTLTSLSAAKISSFIGRNRLAAGLSVVVLGIATLAMPMMGMFASGEHAHHRHHSMSD